MKILNAAAISAFVALAPAPLRAAEASPEQAQLIVSGFEKYFGRTTAGAAPVVRVAPQGELYRIDLDLKALAAPLEKLGFVLAPATITFATTPRPDGLWQVSQDAMPPIEARLPDGITSMRFGAVALEGLYDPSLPGFVSGTSDIADLANEQRSIRAGGPAMTMTRTTARLHAEVASKPEGPGVVVLLTTRQTMTGTKQHVAMSLPTPGAGMTEFDIRMGVVDIDAGFDRFQVRALLDLWAWFVANPSAEAIRAKQAELRTLVRAALPLFDKFKAEGVLKDLTVDAAMGHFGAASASVGVDLNGVAQRGVLSERIAVSGLKIPAGLVPPFAAGLVPTDISVDFTVSGYDAASVADLVLANIDLTATPPLKPEIGAQAQKLVLPDGAVTIRLGKSRIASPLAEITLEGEMKAGPARQPTGSGVISAKGLDAVVKALNDAAQIDPNVRNAMLALAAARGFGQPGPDGATVWRIEVGEDGRVAVNGMSLGPLGRR